MGLTVTNNSANLSASTKTSNLLLNTDLAYAPDDGIVTLSAVSSAGGINVEFGVGSDKAVTDREIIYIGTTLLLDHIIAQFYVAGGSPLSFFLRETAGAATTDVLWKVEFEEGG
jgi:hypothetical protein